ncbi:MAG: hypothetical protein ACXWKP_18900 [Bradyrhizobium sp.]
MTTLATLLARKRRLTERLQEDPGLHERDEIERPAALYHCKYEKSALPASLYRTVFRDLTTKPLRTTVGLVRC